MKKLSVVLVFAVLLSCSHKGKEVSPAPSDEKAVEAKVGAEEVKEKEYWPLEKEKLTEERHNSIHFYNVRLETLNDIANLYSEEEFPRIAVVDVENCYLGSVEGFERFPLMYYLYISHSDNPLHSADFRGGGEAFNTLTLLDLGIESLSDFYFPDTLEKLTLARNSISKIENISHLSALESLSLKNNNIRKIEGLSGLTTLKKLGLGDNPIEKIENLEGLESLELLLLEHARIPRIENLEVVPTLTNLIINECGIEKIENLEPLQNLVYLDLFGNPISRIEGLDTLKELRALNLNSTNISRIENLEQLHKLVELDLGKNQIEKIENLEGLKKLLRLDLTDNQIRRVENLEVLTGLKHAGLVALGGNPIEEITEASLAFLRSKGLPKDSWLENGVTYGTVRVVK